MRSLLFEGCKGGLDGFVVLLIDLVGLWGDIVSKLVILLVLS